MKRFYILLISILLFLTGCGQTEPAQIVATTLPVYEFTYMLCEGTEISVDRLITQNISCLHDYTLQVKQTKMLEAADLIVISGAGLEAFLADVLPQDKDTINASGLVSESHEHEHDHDHENDPHIWLSVSHAKEMMLTIYDGLICRYPHQEATFTQNMVTLAEKIDQLEQYARDQLSDVGGQRIITFHDGFGYLADDFDITIAKAIEEESGSEASAKELIEVIDLIHNYNIKAIFTEKNGSDSAAKIIAAETGIPVYPLDMAISGTSWFEAMYANINTLKEALQ